MEEVKDKKISEIHERALEVLANNFSKKNKVLLITMKKDNIHFHEEYTSDMYFICKFHAGCFGVNKKGQMPPKIKFSISECEYNIEFNVNEESFLLVLREKKTSTNYISITIN